MIHARPFCGTILGEFGARRDIGYAWITELRKLLGMTLTLRPVKGPALFKQQPQKELEWTEEVAMS